MELLTRVQNFIKFRHRKRVHFTSSSFLRKEHTLFQKILIYYGVPMEKFTSNEKMIAIFGFIRVFIGKHTLSEKLV